MSKTSNLPRSFLGGVIALVGASLIAWQSVLVYYLIIGRVKAGEEHPPLALAAVLVLVGIALTAAGYRISNPRAKGSHVSDHANRPRFR
jgi:hypothetical protein